MILTVFRSRLRPENKGQYEEMAAKVYNLACSMPGFVAVKTFMAEDGERVSLVEFETEDDMRRWRDHPFHRIAQHRGKREFYSEYHIQVCRIERAYDYFAAAGSEKDCVEPDRPIEKTEE